MRKSWPSLIVVGILLQSAPAFADSSTELITMIESLKQQMTAMQSTINEQSLRIQQLEQKSPSKKIDDSTILPLEKSDADNQRTLKKNVEAALPWLKGLKQSGDLRLRMENFDYFDKNNDAGSTGTAADRSRNRFRFRLRWGLEKNYGDDWKAGFRLATGSTTDPTATNATLGNPGYFTFKTILVDRAYATYEPSALKTTGILKGVSIGAGKVENPFQRYSTGIVWDGDVTPEGIYEQANMEFYSHEDTKVNFQTTLGQFIVNENAGTETDAELYGYQGALMFVTPILRMKEPVSFMVAVSYYDYPNWYQTVTSNTASTSFLRTNSIVADDFRVIDVYPEINLQAKGLPVTLWANYVSNLANVGTEDVEQSGGNDIHDADQAWGLGLKLGKTKKKGSWDLAYSYYEIGANASVAAFADSDFGGPSANGYTNRKGHKVVYGFQLTDNLLISWSGYVVRPLNPFNGNSTIGLQSSTNETVFRSQLDLVYKF